MGPGTHIYERIKRGDLPTSKHDAIALLHDIDYLGAKTLEDLEVADKLAISRAGYSLEGLAMRMGLGLRQDFGLDLRGNNPGLAAELREHVYNDPVYRFELYRHGLV